MDSAAVPAMDKVGDAAWFRRFTTILAVFIVLCFALNAVLGRAAYSYTLFWPHAHALVMVSWLDTQSHSSQQNMSKAVKN